MRPLDQSIVKQREADEKKKEQRHEKQQCSAPPELPLTSLPVDEHVFGVRAYKAPAREREKEAVNHHGHTSNGDRYLPEESLL